jgi:TolB protein
LKHQGKQQTIKGNIKVKGPGWLLLRAWSKEAHPDLPDIYPYASTNPVYVTVPGKEVHAKTSATYFLKWLDRLAAAVGSNTGFRTAEEKSYD